MLTFIYLTVLLSTINCLFSYDTHDDVFRDEPPELPDNRRIIVPEWLSEMVGNRDNFDDSDRYDKDLQGDGDDDDDDSDPIDLYPGNIINSYPKARNMFDTLRLNDEVNDLEDRTFGEGRKGHAVVSASANRHRDREMLERNQPVKAEKKDKIVINNESPSRLTGLDRLSKETLGLQGVHIFTGENDGDEDDDNDYEDDDDGDVKPMTLAKKKENLYFDNPMYKWWSHAYERPLSGHKKSSTTEPSSTKTAYKINTEKTRKNEMSFDDEDDDDYDDDDDDDVSSSFTNGATTDNSTQTTTVRPSPSSKTSTSTVVKTKATTTAASIAKTTASTTDSVSPHDRNKMTSSSKTRSRSRKLKTTPATIESVIESNMNKSNTDLNSSNQTLTTIEPSSSSPSADEKDDPEEDPVEIFLNSLYHESDKLIDGQNNISTTISSKSKHMKASKEKNLTNKKTSTSSPRLTIPDSAEQSKSTTNKPRKHKKSKNSTIPATLSDDDFVTASVTQTNTTNQPDLKHTTAPTGLTTDNTKSGTSSTSSTMTPIPTLRSYTDNEFDEDDSDNYEDTIKPLWNPDLFP